MSGNVSWSLVEKLALASGKALAILLISVFFGATHQGYFALFISTSMLAVLAGLFGMEIANNYYAAVHRAPREVGALLGNTLAFAALSVAVVVPITYAVVETPFLESLPDRFTGYVLAAVATGLVFLMLGGLAYGLGLFAVRALASFVHQWGLVAAVCAAIAFPAALGFETVLLGWVVAQSAGILVFLVAILRATGWRVGFDLALLRGQLRYGVHGLAFLLLIGVTMRLDHLLVGWLAGAAAVGVYSIAVAATELLLYLPKGIGSAALTQRGSGQALAAGAFRMTSAAMLAAVLAAALFGPPAILLILGPDFAGAAPALLIMLPGTALFGLGWVAAFAQFGERRTAPGITAALAAAVVTVALDVLLVPLYGVPGAALASSLAYALFGLIALICLARARQIPTRDLARPDIRALIDQIWARLAHRRAGGAGPA